MNFIRTDTSQEWTTSGNQLLVRLEQVSLRRRLGDGSELTVLDGLNVELAPGTVTCIAGRSGSGKTTALRLAAGLMTPSAGRVTWADATLADLSPDGLAQQRARTIGYLPQGGGLVESLTALENVLLPAVPRRVRSADVQRGRDLLEALDITARARNFPAQLSGGEQVRVGLARALFNDAPVLLIDEPTAALDAASAHAVVELLAGLAASHRAVCVASHDPAVLALADHVVRLD